MWRLFASEDRLASYEESRKSGYLRRKSRDELGNRYPLVLLYNVVNVPAVGVETHQGVEVSDCHCNMNAMVSRFID